MTLHGALLHLARQGNPVAAEAAEALQYGCSTSEILQLCLRQAAPKDPALQAVLQVLR